MSKYKSKKIVQVKCVYVLLGHYLYEQFLPDRSGSRKMLIPVYTYIRS